MTSLLAAPHDWGGLKGDQVPRIESVPGFDLSAVDEALGVCRMAGLLLDPWQERVLRGALGVRPDGKWAAPEVGLCVPRQNGKGSILEARELVGLFLFGEQMIVHSAHEFSTSLEAFRRLLDRIEGVPDFDRRISRVSRSHGEEGIELKSGQRIRFRTRTKGGGRGFTVDCLILDEAMFLPEAMVDALRPTLSARPNPQIWYTGSAVDQLANDAGVAFARVRRRGIERRERLAYFEWSVEADIERVPPELASDPVVWAGANPGLGLRVTAEWVAGEQSGGMSPRGFAVERLGIGDWPSDTEAARATITEAGWRSCIDPASSALDPVCFAVDVTPDRSHAAIGVAGLRDDEKVHVEIVDHRAGTGWVVGRLAELVGRHRTGAVVLDSAGPAGSLIPDLEFVGIEPVVVGAREYGQSCGAFYDLVVNGDLRHLGSDELDGAVAGAVKRPMGDAWAWSRKAATDICPLVAATLACWGVLTTDSAPTVWNLDEIVAGLGESDPVPMVEGPRVPAVTFTPF